MHYHQQALSQVLTDQAGGSRGGQPVHLVFPDDTISVGLPTAPVAPQFRANPEGQQAVPTETEEERQARLQREPIVVYASLGHRVWDKGSLLATVSLLGLLVVQVALLLLALLDSSALGWLAEPFYSEEVNTVSRQPNILGAMVFVDLAAAMAVALRNTDILVCSRAGLTATSCFLVLWGLWSPAEVVVALRALGLWLFNALSLGIGLPSASPSRQDDSWTQVKMLGQRGRVP
eukprot:CAMPEP_0204351748 /NCGR_PEP_ID=MMETSP0469-20131031/31356_1 /ASSEMBLY_ACC=CAM_ASM_000384 /TAXON_ID=2969 /ORGANISM="Oxyrrhis marina" /LENGTH=232 /DNA_ID=CAMNT_0051338355 /DNA_START=1 /DNA_END=700 /DNA_ORIENTATION=-